MFYSYSLIQILLILYPQGCLEKKLRAMYVVFKLKASDDWSLIDENDEPFDQVLQPMITGYGFA